MTTLQPPYEIADGAVVSRLHRNEAPLAPPSHVLDAVRAIAAETLRCYPGDAQCELVAKLAARLGALQERVVVANGADEVLCALTRAFAGAGSEVVFMDPSFAMYERAAELGGARGIRVPYRQRWKLSVDDLLARCSPQTALVILGNPNNPTGDALAFEDVAALARALPQALIAVDEVYLAFSERSMSAQLAALPNAVLIGSFSKAAGLAGLRVGYAVAPEPFAAALRAQITPFPLSAPSIAGALAYLDDAPASAAHAVALRAQTARSLDAIENAFAPYASGVWRGGAPFVLLDLPRAAEVARCLRERGIAVRRFEHEALRSCIRVSAGSERDTDALLQALPQVMREVSRA